MDVGFGVYQCCGMDRHVRVNHTLGWIILQDGSYFRMDHHFRMDHSVASAGDSAPACPRLSDTNCALTVPSQTTLPFTNALPSMRTAMRDAPSFQLNITTSIRNWSPGTTGRRKRAFSMPVKTINLSLRSSTSVSSM